MCESYSSECVCEVHLKTARFPISRKPEVGFLRELDTFLRHSMKMLQNNFQASGRPGTNPEIRPKLLQVTLDSLL